MTMASVMCDLSTMPPPFHLFFFLVCFMSSWQPPSVTRRFENRQCFGIYIPAKFSDGFLTRKHILQFLSILVCLRLSADASLTSAFRSFLGGVVFLRIDSPQLFPESLQCLLSTLFVPSSKTIIRVVPKILSRFNPL